MEAYLVKYHGHIFPIRVLYYSQISDSQFVVFFFLLDFHNAEMVFCCFILIILSSFQEDLLTLLTCLM